MESLAQQLFTWDTLALAQNHVRFWGSMRAVLRGDGAQGIYCSSSGCVVGIPSVHITVILGNLGVRTTVITIIT